ncbi:MAG: NUDIX hydrolase [Gammaproteobacteria bacterium]|nr:NUDIX hydrolase [Gammaproteobacteria bacterium]
MVWKPHVTVAAVIEREGRFLLVEEQTASGLKFNQPAGHLEENESLIEAVKREVFEETAWQFEPEALVSIQLWRRNSKQPSYLRYCFTGQCHSHDPHHPLDDGIFATHWLSSEEILTQAKRLRSPLVAIAVGEYLKGERYPLALLKSFLDHE